MSGVLFQGVELSYGRHQIYRNLSFRLANGEIGAVYGPSRTGKSSVLLMASGHLLPTKGEVQIDGKKPDKKRIGLGPITDLSPLFDTLTVEEHLLFQARLHHVSQAKDRVQELLGDYQLEAVRKYRVKDLPHLEQFRTGLATALVHKPALVLIDEPERGLTNEEWDIAYADLRKLSDAGSTVLLTTVLQQVADRCDLVAALPEGEVWRP
ncbi:ABC-type multidrug transport system ATPase subunit [Tumebacillus sp. BK434]|uniref:ATP-binding cassette domain-containing protein n=1 Tax=Tumebacillus sp. BK434 TaxID=2512169 RepID=UPI0010D05FCC|nr:ATP-binding cassette domain-containing protein [Tumebacillus sp. BK434]TCP53788.1 ABC-type multidrug transport system ATPase subunit [Tumebacillus sp. BK434]